jgi:iron complex outermembrane receptor protein
VVKGLASVTLGPAGTGGRIDVTTEYDRGAEAAKETAPWARLSYNGAGDGVRGGAGVKGGTAKIDYSAGLEVFTQRDYDSAGGMTVPANQEEAGGFLSFGHRPTEAQRWSLGAIVNEHTDVSYPALPMDTESSDNRIFNGAYGFEPQDPNGSFTSFRVSLGSSRIDHVMSNRLRTNRPMMEAETHSDATTHRVDVAAGWSFGANSTVTGGVDLNAAERDALRQRHITASDQTFYDHLWPDVSQDDIGLYAEYAMSPATDSNLRLGLRYDRVGSEAAAADDPALGGGTIREAYVAFYGPAAAVTDRDENLVSGNVLFSRNLGDRVTLQTGLGLVSRAAGMTERYFAYAMSPIGLLVGNPTLDAEQKRELSIGARFTGRAFSGSVSGYYYSVRDYILPVILETAPTQVAGFENTDATLIGLDLAFDYRPAKRWSVPGALFYVRGRDDTRDVPLPEIPPLELRLALRRSFSTRATSWLELGGRFVADQDRVDPAFAENPTPGFAVWHLRGRIDVARAVGIVAGVENLLDKEYWEHLTREAAANVPGLTPGQEIPQPGRHLTLALLFDL